MTACAAGPLMYGAIPVFADVDIDSGCIDPDSVEKLITNRTKAILVVHLYGYVAEMDRICDICKKHNIALIEDCAQSHIAKYKGQYVGTFGDIGIFSLNVNKTIQVGEGGICVTSDEDIAYRLQLIRNHGEAVVGPAGYTNITNILGFNYRLSEIHASMAICQLDKVESLTARRLEMVDLLNDQLSEYSHLNIYMPPSDHECTYYQYKLRLDENETGIMGSELIEALNAEGLNFFGGYTPLYMQPLYQQKRLFTHGYPWSAEENRNCLTSYKKGICPVAEKLTTATITSEHIRPPNTLEDMQDIVDIFRKIMD
jgi:dTDP-4-amino-4,6-dideoxygalactose transaminase